MFRFPSFSSFRTVSLLLFLMGMNGCRTVTDSLPVQAFETVAVRRPSGVAMSPGMPSMMGERKTFPLVLSGTLQWIDGQTYDSWTSVPLEKGLFAATDPMFSDVYYGLGSQSTRVSELYTSGDKSLGVVYWVDSRVGLIAAPRGSPVTVLEKSLSTSQGLRFEQGLVERGFNVGEVDGVIDEQTRSAVNTYLEAKGLPYRFATPVITEALFAEVTSTPAQ